MKNACVVSRGYRALGLSQSFKTLIPIALLISLAGCSALVTGQRVMITLPTATVERDDAGMRLNYHYREYPTGEEKNVNVEVENPKASTAGIGAQIIAAIGGVVAAFVN